MRKPMLCSRPCVSQLVFTVQNEEPQEAWAWSARQNSTAAYSSLLRIFRLLRGSLFRIGLLCHYRKFPVLHLRHIVAPGCNRPIGRTATESVMLRGFCDTSGNGFFVWTG